jgi:hypothetical protein
VLLLLLLWSLLLLLLRWPLLCSLLLVLPSRGLVALVMLLL